MIPPEQGRSALAASAPGRVLDRLWAAPDGPVPVVHRAPLAVYVEVSGWCVGVVAAGAAQIPCALRTRADGFPAGVARTAHVAGGVLHLDARPLRVGRVEDVAVPRLDRRAVLGRQAAAGDPAGPVAVLVAGRAGRGVDVGAVSRLVGWGDGLTPLGDDVLAGWLAAARAVGVATPAVDEAVRAHLHRTTLLSATLLDCALHGEVLPEVSDFLAAVGTATGPARAAALSRVGGSSGAGLLAGARLALRQLLTDGARVA